MCPTASNENTINGKIYYDPVSSNGNCPVYDCDKSQFDTHPFNHGDDLSKPHHALFCKYT